MDASTKERYQAVLAKLEYQAGHAIVWRDAICSWFLKNLPSPMRKAARPFSKSHRSRIHAP